MPRKIVTYKVNRSTAGGERGAQGDQGSDGPYGIVDDSAPLGDDGAPGHPGGGTCSCRLDQDLQDVNATGASDSYLTYHQSDSKWKHTLVSLDSITIGEIDFSNIPAFECFFQAYNTLPQYSLYRHNSDPSIIRLRPTTELILFGDTDTDGWGFVSVSGDSDPWYFRSYTSPDTAVTRSSYCTNPDDGSDHANSLDITVTFTVAQGQCELTYDHYTENCCDYARFYDGTTTGDTQLLEERGGPEYDNTISSSGSSITVLFHSDGSVTRNPGICITRLRNIINPPDPPSDVGNDNCCTSNDTPCCATVLTVNTDTTCTFTTSGTLENATASGVANSCSGTPDDDVWFKFVATDTTHVIEISNLGGSPTFSIYHSVFESEDCNSLGSEITCSTVTSSKSTGLTIGNTYFIRVYHFSASANPTTTFDICVRETYPPPANDDPCGALTVTVNENLTCASTTSGTLLGATSSSVANGCSGSTDEDVWFKFVATATIHIVEILNLSGSPSFSIYHSIFESEDCNSLGSEITCSTATSSKSTGLTIGNTYYIRVYYSSTVAEPTTTFDVCVREAPPPPANDDPCGALTVTVNADQTCTSTTAGTLVGATQSSVTNTCSGTTDEDVWFKFVALETSQIVEILNISGSPSFSIYHSIFESEDCNSLGSEIVCSTSATSNPTGLTIGNTYYIRVYYSTTVADPTTTFDVCVRQSVAPPANDDPCNAATLTVNTDGSCTNFLTGTVEGATTSSHPNGCSGTADDDVWYKFVAANTTQIIDLLNVSGSTTDLYHSIYESEDCNDLGSEIKCSDPNTSTTTGLTIGNTYYVRVYSWTSTANQNTTFDICVKNPPPAPDNDEPCSATALTVNTDGTCTIKTSATTTGATASGVGTTAPGTPDDDVWFSFVATATEHVIEFSDITGTTTDIVHVVYSGTCGSLTEMWFHDDPNTPGAGAMDVYTIGETYFIRVYSYSSAAQTIDFDICVRTV